MYKNRTISFDEPSLEELKELRKMLRLTSDSHTIREAIYNYLKLLQKESA